jgi:hypothetical protein
MDNSFLGSSALRLASIIPGFSRSYVFCFYTISLSRNVATRAEPTLPEVSAPFIWGTAIRLRGRNSCDVTLALTAAWLGLCICLPQPQHFASSRESFSTVSIGFKILKWAKQYQWGLTSMHPRLLHVDRKVANNEMGIIHIIQCYTRYLCAWPFNLWTAEHTPAK